MAITVTASGQVTLPKSIQDFLGIGPGSEVDFRRTADGQVILVPEHGTTAKGRFARFKGHAKAGLTTDEIMALTRGEE